MRPGGASFHWPGHRASKIHEQAPALTYGTRDTPQVVSGLRRLGPQLKCPQLKWWRVPVVQAAKTALAGGLSWYIAADVLGNSLPVFAPLAAILTVQVTVWDSVSRGLQRVLGVIAGVLVAFGFARLLGVHIWSVVLVVFFSWLAGQALRLGPQGAVQVPVTGLLVLILGTSTSEYAVDRVVDTFVGAGVGVAVSLVALPRTHVADARAEVRGLASQVADLLRAIATSLGTPGGDASSHLGEARLIHTDAEKVALAVQNSVAATRWNPTGYRDRPAAEELDAALKTLGPVEHGTRDIARVLVDAAPILCLPPQTARPLSAFVHQVGDEVDAWATRVTGGEAPPEEGGKPSVASLFHDVLLSARSTGINPETAAIVDAIAIFANRISDELSAQPEPAPTKDRLSWRSLFNP